MFEFRDGETGQFHKYEGLKSRPEGSRSEIYLLRMSKTEFPKGIKLSKNQDYYEKHPGVKPLSVSMMVEDDEEGGWAWEQMTNDAKSWFGDYFLDCIDEGQYTIGEWVWFKINRS